MPFNTEFAAVKLPRAVAVNVRVAALLSRESKATSEGELARVGTLPEGGTVESSGNTR